MAGCPSKPLAELGLAVDIADGGFHILDQPAEFPISSPHDGKPLEPLHLSLLFTPTPFRFFLPPCLFLTFPFLLLSLALSPLSLCALLLHAERLCMANSKMLRKLAIRHPQA